MVRSSTYAGPLGAQYSPVLLMSKSSMKDASDWAASSGVTAIELIIVLVCFENFLVIAHIIRRATYLRRHPNIYQIQRFWSFLSA